MALNILFAALASADWHISGLLADELGYFWVAKLGRCRRKYFKLIHY